MFEEILPKNALKVINQLSTKISDFYLAGGTGLALQLGHRKSADLDFFSLKIFSTEFLLKNIQPDKTLLVQEGTVHCQLGKVKLSFLFYNQPLVFPLINWRGVKLADWRDILAEKFKAISQRGTKKDFYDLYATIQLRLSIEEACIIFKKRFGSSGINMYHILKSLIFFEEAEDDPPPLIVMQGKEWQWEKVKKFFILNIRKFEKHLMD